MVKKDVVKVCWTGAAGLEFSFGGKTVLVDPYYTRISKLNMLFGNVYPDLYLTKKIKEKKGEIAAIIASHTHFDHVVDIPGFAGGSDSLVIGSNSLDALMTANNMSGRTIVCSGNEKIQMSDDASVTMIPSEHGRVAFGKVPFQGDIEEPVTLPMKAGEYRVGKVFSPKIDIFGKSFLHIGSAGFTEDNLSAHKCDVVFVCVPGWKNTKDYPEKIIELTKPATVVLFHFDDFFKRYSHVRDYKSKTKKLLFLDMKKMIHRIRTVAPGIRVIVPELFETYEF